MQDVGLYHLNAYTYADTHVVPRHGSVSRAMYQRVTKGSLSGKAGEKAHEDFKINGQYVTPRRRASSNSFFDGYVEKAAAGFLIELTKPAACFSRTLIS